MTGATNGGEPLLLALPGAGAWQARNSPARRVPSHGTHALGTTYAIDLVPVDERGRSAPFSWRTLLATEPAEAFVGFGRPVTSAASGRVAAVHDAEPDIRSHRSLLAAPRFLATQGERLRQGPNAVVGNHVIVEIRPGGPFVLVAHLQRGSVRVRPGEDVVVGQPLGACGNSGNTTLPHVHLQVTDSMNWRTARGLPLAFESYRRLGDGALVRAGVPAEGENVVPA